MVGSCRFRHPDASGAFDASSSGPIHRNPMTAGRRTASEHCCHPTRHHPSVFVDGDGVSSSGHRSGRPLQEPGLPSPLPDQATVLLPGPQHDRHPADRPCRLVDPSVDAYASSLPCPSPMDPAPRSEFHARDRQRHWPPVRGSCRGRTAPPPEPRSACCPSPVSPGPAARGSSSR